MIVQGQTYCDWLYTGNSKKNKNRQNIYECVCQCGNISWLTKRRLLQQDKFLRCDSCARKLTRKGYGDITGKQYAAIKYSAKKRNIEFSPECTKEYLWNLFLKQKGCCKLSGVPICMKGYTQNKATASLDRIDSSIGYIPGNLQWVHMTPQFMKQDYPQPEFLSWSSIITKYNESKKFSNSTHPMCRLPVRVRKRPRIIFTRITRGDGRRIFSQRTRRIIPT